MKKSVLEFDVGVIYVNDNAAKISLGKLERVGDDENYHFSVNSPNTMLEEKDLRAIADKLKELNR